MILNINVVSVTQALIESLESVLKFQSVMRILTGMEKIVPAKLDLSLDPQVNVNPSDHQIVTKIQDGMEKLAYVNLDLQLAPQEDVNHITLQLLTVDLMHFGTDRNANVDLVM